MDTTSAIFPIPKVELEIILPLNSTHLKKTNIEKMKQFVNKQLDRLKERFAVGSDCRDTDGEEFEMAIKVDFGNEGQRDKTDVQ